MLEREEKVLKVLPIFEPEPTPEDSLTGPFN
jgi:hypothetical protein